MRETSYWLRIIREPEGEEGTDQELKRPINESEELKKILGAIVRKTDN